MTIMCWAGFNVAAKAGINAELSPAASSFLRYSTPALLATRVWFRLRRRAGRGRLPLGRLFVFALLGGPIFGLIAVAGYQFAPLSQGLLFAPVADFVAGLAWMRVSWERRSRCETASASRSS
ncbi:hypothetical protein [Jannaschia formosa]|uniref:hypothetical protein n=1 Tax=Jannaschia formosa TaxID=2259592 RepID=UPI00107582AB|nr:hypothetical protein [Jannaschia formosa]TFL16351.1 hypothetical protein DR046_20510 [Jannaschia formosa]